MLQGSEASDLGLNMPAGDASGLTNGISTQRRRTAKTSGRKNSLRVTSARSRQTVFQTLTCSLEASPVSLLVWLENVRGSEIFVAQCFSRLPESQRLKDPKFFCLKTSEDSSATTTEKRLKPSCERWGTWGIGGSTRCLTANTLGFRRIGSGCSLSGILEEQESVPDKYFLSEKMVSMLQKTMEKGKFVPRLLHDTTNKATVTPTSCNNTAIVEQTVKEEE